MIDAAVDALGMRDVMGAIVSSDEVAAGKPAPDVYLVAAARLGVAPARCLVVEDSINGVRAGKAAGMTVVLVPNASVPPPPGTRDRRCGGGPARRARPGALAALIRAARAAPILRP